jgi:hypothetical protein
VILTCVAFRVKIDLEGGSSIGCGGCASLRGEWFEVDLVPELLELADEPCRALLGGASVEVVGAEFVVGDVLVEDVVGGDEDGVAEGAGCFAGAAAAA